jgi:hypothetical protein
VERRIILKAKVMWVEILETPIQIMELKNRNQFITMMEIAEAAELTVAALLL